MRRQSAAAEWHNGTLGVGSHEHADQKAAGPVSRLDRRSGIAASKHAFTPVETQAARLARLAVTAGAPLAQYRLDLPPKVDC